MNKPFAPLLAKAVEWQHLDYTNLWVSKKLDGIRAIVRDRVVLSRKLLPIPNAFVQYTFGIEALEGFDGELIVGPANASDVYSKTYSGVMKATGEPDVTFHVFDHVTNPMEEYCRRYNMLSEKSFRWVEVVPQHGVMGEQDVLDIEAMYLEQGYEGVMLRAHSGPRSFYKYGRSTAKETTLLKLKRLDDFEAMIVGIEEEMFNGNEATKDELGHTKRSSHAENKVGKGTMGVMNCVIPETGVDFKCGIFKGFDADWKKRVWSDPTLVTNQLGKFQKLGIGEKDRPRHPRFIGLRSPLDMSA